MHNTILEKSVSRFGSPLYVYDLNFLKSRAAHLYSTFFRAGIDVLYAVKANSNAFILKALCDLGFSFDACSVGEVLLLLKIGVNPRLIHFNADGVSLDEMRELSCTNVNLTVGSIDHLRLLVHKKVEWRNSITLRINTGFGAGHSPAVVTGGDMSKFGISIADMPIVRAFCEREGICVSGLHAHAGSGIDEISDYVENARRLIDVAHIWADSLDSLNFGGGLPYEYGGGHQEFDCEEMANRLIELTRTLREKSPLLRLMIEPGRCVVAGSGVLLCTVTSSKTQGARKYITVDSGFNHLARPFLYGAYHQIDNISASENAKTIVCDIVGNLCQSGDVFARDREIHEAKVGDLLCIRDVGAYGYSMASNYNSRPRPAEVAISNEGLILIRNRETFEELFCRQNLG